MAEVSYAELMERKAVLMEHFKALNAETDHARYWSVGVLLGKAGELTLPMYTYWDNERVLDLMMMPGDTLVTVVRSPEDQEQVEPLSA